MRRTTSELSGQRPTVEWAASRGKEEALYWYQGQYFGMHFFWWMFWVVLIIMFFGWTVPVPRRMVRMYREDALGILQRRYAAGEITTEEYEERKSRIQKDTGTQKP